MIVDYETMRYDRLLEGKRCLLSGGNGEIGREIARLFAAQGARLALTDVRSEGAEALVEELNTLSEGNVFIAADFTDEAQTKRMLEEVLDHLGYVDVLVNNAGVFLPGVLHESKSEDLEKMLAVNLKGAVECTRGVIPGMMERCDGTIVSVVSDYATHAAPGISQFAASKAALMAFTKGVGKDYCKYDIRANCVMPGYTVTTMGEYYKSTMSEERIQEHYTYGQCIQRRGTAEDVANAALYLASPMSRFVTGECIPVNGGVQAFAHKQMLTHAWER